MIYIIVIFWIEYNYSIYSNHSILYVIGMIKYYIIKLFFFFFSNENAITRQIQNQKPNTIGFLYF